MLVLFLLKKKSFPKISYIFANSFKIGKHGNRHDVLEKYREYIT